MAESRKLMSKGIDLDSRQHGLKKRYISGTLQITRRPFLASLSEFIAVAEFLARIVSSLFIGMLVLASLLVDLLFVDLVFFFTDAVDNPYLLAVSSRICGITARANRPPLTSFAIDTISWPL